MGLKVQKYIVYIYDLDYIYVYVIIYLDILKNCVLYCDELNLIINVYLYEND